MAKYNEVLKGLRKQNNLTQSEVAKFLNIEQRTYAHYEKGDREPSIETLIKLADYYKLPIDIIVGRYNIAE